MTRKTIHNIIIFVALSGNAPSYAQPDSPPNSERYEYDYPELSVVPRASDRLKIEADRERERKLANFLPVQISALSTLVSGVASMDSSNPGAGSLAIGVGLGWLITTATLSFTYNPYYSGSRKVNSMPKGGIREQLTKERVAEEEIRYAADVGSKIKWLSWASNFGASLYMISQFRSAGTFENYASSSAIPSAILLTGAAHSELTRGLEFASLALSFVPLIFKFHWNDVFDTQSDYKKRIYAPVAMTLFFEDSVSRRLLPGAMLKFNF